MAEVCGEQWADQKKTLELFGNFPEIFSGNES